jgi:hypothetical protein
LGSAVIVAYLTMAAVSYIQAPALWAPAYAPNATAFFTELYGNHHVAAIRAFFGGPFAILASRFVPLIAASLAAITLIILVSRDDCSRDDALARRVLRWAFAFSAVSFFAYPVFTQDFWLSAVWGDMVASGANPYHEKFTPEMLTGFPLDHFPMTMSYGPLWALISGAVMTLAGGSLLVAAILFKSMLLAAWCASLVLIDRIMREAAPRHRVMALVIAGWVPLGVMETVAEGHNDIMLVLPALLWIFLLLQQNLTAPFALAASVLCKYTTAPLFIVDLLHHFRARGLSVRHYVLRMAPVALFGLIVFGLFFRSLGFFDGVLLVDSWHFMQPSDAFLVLSDLLNGWPEPLEAVILAIFPAIAIYQTWVYWNAPDTDNVLRLTLAAMCAVSFALIGHVWPWYLVWTLPLAALVPGWWLSRFIVGMSLAAPFTAIVWWVPAAEDFKNEAALVMYAAAVLWAYWTSREEPEAVSRAAPAPVRLIDFMRFKDARAAARPARRAVAGAYDADAPVPAKVASGEN